MKLKILLFSLGIFFTSNVFALRCGHQLVNVGDSKHDVLAICGQPESVDTHIERRGASQFVRGQQRAGKQNGIGYGQQQYIEIDVEVEEWIYDFGSRRLQQYLRFENGRLKEIKNLGRGD